MPDRYSPLFPGDDPVTRETLRRIEEKLDRLLEEK
jgi:hypothetical protein